MIPDKIYVEIDNKAHVYFGLQPENAEEYIRKDIVDDMLKTAEDHAYLAGAVNEREKMLKEAVEGVVMDFSSNQPRPQVDVYVDPHKYHTGDKVRIIILKEE